MKKLLLASLVLTCCGCNYEVIDTTLFFNKVHIYETNKCFVIDSWRDYENGEQLQINLTNYGKILISSTDCFLVKDSCPICDC